MITPQYITDNKGKKLSVILSVKEYNKIMEELEELEDIRLYDEAMANSQKSIPINKAFKAIEAKRKK
jgi:PHD/YefM family antitoxin component YafN of YafNO toxin-antitoxin module